MAEPKNQAARPAATQVTPPAQPKAEAKKPPAQRTARESAAPRPKAKAPKPKPIAPQPINGPLAWQWPTSGRVVERFSSEDRTRNGLKIAGRTGQPILAAEGGRIVYSGSGLIGYGQLIIIKHNKNYLSAYGHNRKILVKEGDQVARGAHIGEMGKPPDDQPLLHFEIRRQGTPVDPLRLLPKQG
jgi:lipoprotein NlpD